MLILGLTGNIGCGKSSLSKILMQNNIDVLKENEIVKYGSTVIPYFYSNGNTINYYLDGSNLIVNQFGMVMLNAGAGN